jgi:hypothetical protein
MSDFVLRPYEHMTGGLKWSDETLTLRPSIASRAISLCGLAMSVIYLVVGTVTAAPFVLAVAAVGGAVFGRHLTCRVVAADGRLVVVNKWRRRSLRVADVKAIVIERYRPGFGFLPFGGVTQLWPRTFTAGTLVLQTGDRVRMDALVGMPPARGDEVPTPLETKFQVLERWIHSHGGAGGEASTTHE